MTSLAQRVTQSGNNEAAHTARIAKAHLSLGWVDINVNIARVELEEKRNKRLAPSRKEVTIGCAQRADQNLVANRATIDEQELQCRVATIQRRQPCETGN